MNNITMKTEELKERIFECYALKKEDKLKNFSSSKKISIATGNKESDLKQLKLKIKEIIPLLNNVLDYRGTLCGYFCFKKNNLILGTIYYSLDSTLMSLNSPKDLIINKEGVLVSLEIIS
jgi:hypothetical protein